MAQQLFLFSTEPFNGVNANLSLLIKVLLKDGPQGVALLGIASGHKNGNEKLAKQANIQFEFLRKPDVQDYEHIFKRHPDARFLFWDWHENIPAQLFYSYRIFLLSPGPIEKFQKIAGPMIYTEAWHMAQKGEPLIIGLFDLKNNGKRLWGKKIPSKKSETRKAINARLHYYMRQNISEIIAKVFA